MKDCLALRLFEEQLVRFLHKSILGVLLSFEMWSTASYNLIHYEQLLLALWRVMFDTSKLPYPELWHCYSSNIVDVVDISIWLLHFWIGNHPTAYESSKIFPLLFRNLVDHLRPLKLIWMTMNADVHPRKWTGFVVVANSKFSVNLCNLVII